MILWRWWGRGFSGGLVEDWARWNGGMILDREIGMNCLAVLDFFLLSNLFFSLTWNDEYEIDGMN